MASGLFALLDDVAMIARVAAASIDDVAAATAKAGSKSLGILIDDAAVTPKYVTGFAAKREIPMIWRITKGSLRNKLIFLVPIFMLLVSFAPWALTPLLMVGGAFLCFEAAEKVMEKLGLHQHHAEEAEDLAIDPVERENDMVNGAIRTDLILSAEILAISLGELGELPLLTTFLALVAVSFGVTFLVYGVVALIVKMDDFGVMIARRNRGFMRQVGLLLVRGMPKLLTLLTVVGTAAMAWVGGGILVHGLEELNILTFIPHSFHDWAAAAGAAVPFAQGFVKWFVGALLAGLLALVVGTVIALGVGLIGKMRSKSS